MKKYFIICCVFMAQCTPSPPKASITESIIDFGNTNSYKTSDIIFNYSFIQLETMKETLIGEISQIIVYNNKIYILDTYSTRSLFVFSIEGKFLNKLEGLGNGPGEFISPHSFFVDQKGDLYILDAQLSRLLKYDSSKLTFIEEIILPIASPLSFYVLPEEDQYIYYCIAGMVSGKEKKQVIVADKQGNILNEFWDAPLSGKVLHGPPNVFYNLDGKVNFNPYFSNKIYTMDDTSLECKNEIFFGENKLVNEEMFMKHEDSKKIMGELLIGDKDWIRLLYIYETINSLVVKYYIRKDFYVGMYNKTTSRKLNFKYAEVKDDLGIGGKYPLPIGTNEDQFIGILYPHEIDKRMVSDASLKRIIDKGIVEDDNPILILYSLKE